MSLTRKIAHNTIYQIVGKIASTILGVVAIAMMTRYLGTQGYGQYTTVMAYLQFFGILVDMGFSMTTIQMSSKEGADQNKVVSNIFTLRLMSSVVFLGLAPMIVWLFPYPTLVKQGVAVTAISFVFISLTQIITAVFQKELKMFKISFAEVIGRTGLVLAAFLAIHFQKSLLWILGAVVLNGFLHFLFAFIFSRSVVKIKLKFDWPIWKEAYKLTWPIAISIAFNLIYLKADTIILSLTKTQEQVGLYGAGYRVIDILVMFPYMFVGLLMPLLSKYWQTRDQENFQRIVQRGFDFLVIIGLPLVVGTQFLATDVMVLVAGTDFAISGLILRVLILAAGCIYVGSYFGTIVVSINMQKKMIFAYMTGAIISFIGYLYFIPKYGIWGAAGMTVFSEAYVMIIVLAAVLYKTKVKLSLKVFGKAILACLMMASALVVMRDQYWLIRLMAAVFMYFVVMFALRAISKRDLTEILRLK